MISVIIPAYNEEKSLPACLASLRNQTQKDIEIIVIDDGSTDRTKQEAKKFSVKTLEQSHKGPGSARNLGAKNARGEILVFVDSDMTFDKNFIKELTKPITNRQSIGTFSKEEMVSNSSKIWSICWNINRNVPKERMLPTNYPDKSPVYRAILKKEFTSVGGFELSGDYTDDWSLSAKLGQKATLAAGAIYYHANPETIQDVWRQASWIGKNRFISGSLLRKCKSIVLYSPPIAVMVGVIKSILNLQPAFVIFKVIYNSSVLISVLRSFFSSNKSK